jgi:hypothetical protein
LVERLPAFVLAAIIFFLGVQPTWLVRWTETTTNAMVASIPAKIAARASTSVSSSTVLNFLKVSTKSAKLLSHRKAIICSLSLMVR